MKKYLCLILAIIMLIAMSSCGKADNTPILTESEYISSGYDGKTGFSFSLYEDYSVITGYDGKEKSVRIPTKIDSKKVKSIGTEAFRDNKIIEEIIFPDSLLVIEDGAFMNCTAMKKLSFPDRLYSIGASAFSGNSELTTVRFPMELEKIGGYAFGDCKKLKNVTVPNDVKSIGGGAFLYTPWFDKNTDEFIVAGDKVLIGLNSESESVIIPDGIKQVSAFYGNYSVKNVTFSDSVTSVGDFSFANSAIEEITLSEGVNSIGENAFDSCMQLKKITMNQNLKTIGQYAFSSCPLLEKVTVPEKVRMIGDGAFARCEGLKTAVLEGYSTQLGMKPFDSCSKLEKISGQKGSYAEKYAESFNIRFEVLD